MRHCILMAVALPMLVLAGCGPAAPQNSDVRTSVAGDVTPTAVPCPPPTNVDFTGAVDESCVRKAIGWDFRLPRLSGFWRPVFQFNPSGGTELRVWYYPANTGSSRVLVDIFPRENMVFYGDEDLTSPGGHEVGIGSTVYGFAGGWSDSTSTYIASVVDGADSPSNRELILTAADSILNAGDVTATGAPTTSSQ